MTSGSIRYRALALALFACGLAAQDPAPVIDPAPRALQRLRYELVGFVLPAAVSRALLMVSTECEEAPVCIPHALHEADEAPPMVQYTVRKLKKGYCGCDIVSLCGLVAPCEVDIDVDISIPAGKHYRWRIGDLPQSECLPGGVVRSFKFIQINGCGDRSPLIEIWYYNGGDCSGDADRRWLQWECTNESGEPGGDPCDSLSCLPLP